VHYAFFYARAGFSWDVRVRARPNIRTPALLSAGARLTTAISARSTGRIAAAGAGVAIASSGDALLAAR
jgi:hypothetical protein